MKRLIVCCDGTWNTPDQEDQGRPAPTNVFKLYNCVADRADGVEQLRYYHTGVGTEGTPFDRVKGGAYGEGLGRNIQSAYHWLATHHKADDPVFLFGFSRGAFTVRSLAGLIQSHGLVSFDGMSPDKQWAVVERTYQAYRDRDERHADARQIDITFVGVWDTVGALGIPNDLAILNLLDSTKKWRFHDVGLGSRVKCARHAVALDEQRASFTPTLWKGDDKRVKQFWFPGVHSDVGGGYADTGLSDGALQWMGEEAAAQGLGFRTEMTDQITPNSQGQLHNSVTGAFKVLRTRPRNVPLVAPRAPAIHESALKRQARPPIIHPPYRLSRTLEPGEPAELDVFAQERWNETHLYLEKGATYDLAASGEWLDSRIKSGPGGTADGTFHPGELAHLIGTAWGWGERLYKKVTGNQQADFWFTRRVESAPWFSLIGVIANDGDDQGGNPGNDGSPAPHETFLIGDGVTHSVTKPGYLYVFANDAWAKYENNRGSVRLRVTRITPESE